MKLRFWKKSTPDWVTDSPALGAGLRPTPCDKGPRPAKPAESESPVAVALSGGGFRATLAGVGALRLLAGTGALADLRYLSSVSGGSIANALVAKSWPELRADVFSVDAFDRLVTEPLVAKITSKSLKRELIQGVWRTFGPSTRTELLADKLDDWFFDGLKLHELDPEVRWIFSAANLPSGVRFTFERDVFGDYTIGLVSTQEHHFKLSLAVAASSAVPGNFAPVVLDDITFPCHTVAPTLLDGGVYDNTGLEALDGESYRDVFLFVMNSGGLLNIRGYSGLPIVAELMRANSLLYRQSTTLRTRVLVDQFKRGGSGKADEPLEAGARRGVIAALASDFDHKKPTRMREWVDAHPEHRTWKQADLALVPTVFNKLDESLCRALIYRGWWLMGASLATYHPTRLPDVGIASPANA